MGTKLVPGELVALSEAAHIAREASARIAHALRAAMDARGRATIALSGGNTPRDTYARLATEAGVDWAKLHVFWVDERAAAPTDDRSNYRWAKATLLDAAPIPPGQIHRMPAERPDLEAAAADYEQTLRDTFGAAVVPELDVAVLGIGDDGHTASLFPGEPTIAVVDRLVAVVGAKPGREARMTLTKPVLLQARNAFVLASGAAKHAPLERVWDIHGSERETPSRILRDCRGSLVWVVDRAAAGLA